ncbi:dihydrofolate reductase family protein [Enterovibrio makurazakiensis]|uniref:dihydrofolate reductase family protein n=1 Tax=Enterovibrio makurazakiensis TaxID=2910232 RepID=UPI003D1BFF88
MKIVAYMAQSLDGFIAGVNGELDWLETIENPEGSDFGFAEFMDSVDALLMGRNTFEKVLSFGMWPYNKPVYVASNSLLEVPEELACKAHIISGELQSMLSQMQQQGINTVYLDGGKLFQSALRSGVLNEMTITSVPVALGQGISLFGDLENQVQLKLESSEVLLNQLVKTKYRVVHQQG